MIKKLIKNYQPKTGISTLLLVFLVLIIASLILFAMSLGAYLQVKKSSQINLAHQVYYAAEGCLYETIQHLKDTSLPVPASGTTIYNIGNAVVNRSIGESSGVYDINIVARLAGIKREIKASYGEKTTANILDVVLVLDISGSMGNGSIGTPLYYAKEAAKKFVNILAIRAIGDKIAIVTYAEDVSGTEDSLLNASLTDDYNGLVTTIDAINGTIRATNMSAGFNEGIGELELNATNAIQVIIFMSDGLANR